MSSAILDNTIYKLIVLFVFDKMEIPITEKTLLDLCSTDNNWLNYMECKETLSGLIDAGFVYHSDDSANGKLYSITPDGRLCLSHFFIRIPSTLRESIAEYIKSNRIKYRKKQEYFSDYFKNPDGSYTVVLKIIEPGRPLLDLKLNVADRHKAKWIFKNWEENAPQIYSALYSMLVE